MSGLPRPAMEGQPAFLAVDRSACGRRWQEAAADERLTRALMQRHGLPELVARLLAGRGIGLEEAPRHLSPRLRDQLPDPAVLRGMDEAAGRIAAAIMAGETIGILADYDVDGAASGALLVRYLRQLGAPPPLLHVPDRQREGYGPNAPALRGLGRQGARLVLTVDCGTTAFAPLTEAKAAGLDVVVIDHHAAESTLPPALAVVNPNRLDQPRGGAVEAARLGQLAACGVTFLVLVAVSRTLRQAGFFARRPEPDLLALLDLVALGSICDVVPLSGLNRAFVAQGLRLIARRANPGVAALADQAKVTARPDDDHAAFVLGPRINAGGRIGQSDLGLRLLATDDAAEAAELAARLEVNNDDRKQVERAVLDAAIRQVEAEAASGDARQPILLVAGEGWHPGVIGIVAGRLKDRYNRAVCVVALEGDTGRASGRSMPGIDLGAAILEARRAGLLVNGGGHAMAAGFTVERGKLAALGRFLAGRAASVPAAAPAAPVLTIEGTATPAGVTVELAEALARLGPFGQGNRQPVIAVPAVRAVDVRPVGAGHVCCRLVGPDGGSLRAVAFRAGDTGLGRLLLTGQGAPLHIAGTLRLDEWNGTRRVELRICDASPAWGAAAPPPVPAGIDVDFAALSR